MEQKKLDVAVIIGSESDLALLKESKMLEVFIELGVTYEVSIISAHRNSEPLKAYCRQAIDRRIKVFIAAAGKAAHLPGAIASSLVDSIAIPVIGVALPSSECPNAQDALYSIVGMPSGVPVACTGIGKSGLFNASLLACQIMAVNNEILDELLHSYRRRIYKRPQIAILPEK